MDEIRAEGPAAVRSARTCARRSSRSPPSAAATTPRSSSGSAAPTSTSSRRTPTCSSRSSRRLPGVVDADTNLVVGKPELGVHIDRAKAGDLGVQRPGRRRDPQRARRRPEGDGLLRGRRAVRGARSARRRTTARIPPASPRPRCRRRAAPCASQDVVRFEQGTGPSLVNRLGPPAAGAPLREHAARLLGADDHGRAVAGGRRAEDAAAEYSYGFTGRSREQGKAARNFLLAFLAVVHLHVPDPRRAVRELDPPDHDPPRAAADRAVRAAVDRRPEPVDQHLLVARHPGAVRHREEERRSCRSTT